jgi:hypothetical protein
MFPSLRVFGGLRFCKGWPFFIWSAALGKILSMDNLQKWHVIVVDRCGMCKGIGESIDHFLLNCEIACAIWNVFFYRFRLS